MSEQPGPQPSFLRMEAICKRFDSMPALDRAAIECERGSIHGVLGENGAGKTTLMRILAGLTQLDSGTITIDGRPMQFRSPTDACDAGIGMVHQHFMLVADLTGIENIALSRGWHAARAAARSDLASSLSVDLTKRISALSMGERQRLEILRALLAAREILILDEPTAVLAPEETEPLFALLRSLRESGRTIIFISHKLAEVKGLCDKLTVLRRGRVVGAGSASSFSLDHLAELMVGDRETTQPPSLPRPGACDRVILEMNCEGSSGFGPLSLELREGEILGVAGVDGNGQRELMSAAAGFRGSTSDVLINGVRCRNASDAARAGLRVIPPDRRHEGIVPSMTIAENFVLGNEHAVDRRWWCRWSFSRAANESAAERAVAEYDIRATRGAAAPARTLSGGNQQKLLLARVFAAHPRVIVAVNPTWGLDIKATAAIHELLKSAAAGGDGRQPAGILLISVDLDEIEALADRVVVLYRGKLSESLRPDSPDIARRMAGLGMRLDA